MALASRVAQVTPNIALKKEIDTWFSTLEGFPEISADEVQLNTLQVSQTVLRLSAILIFVCVLKVFA